MNKVLADELTTLADVSVRENGLDHGRRFSIRGSMRNVREEHAIALIDKRTEEGDVKDIVDGVVSWELQFSCIGTNHRIDEKGTNEFGK